MPAAPSTLRSKTCRAPWPLGTFAVASRPERTGRNPSTGEPMTIKASKAPKFTAGKALKDAVNAVAAK